MKSSNTFKVTIDRFEGNFAVCEIIPKPICDGFGEIEMQDIELSKIPFQVQERDVLLVRYSLNKEIEVISKVQKNEKRRKINSRLIRFH